MSRMLKWIFICLLSILVVTESATQNGDTYEIRVVDENNEALEGVLVYIQDYSYSTITSELGTALLPLDESDPFIFSYLGYTDIQKTISEMKELEGVITLPPAFKILEEIEVVGRADRSQGEIVQQIETVSREEMMLTQPQTSADALGQHGGVYLQKSQLGGGSPIVRGFEANKILLVVDGVRMNNAIYRNGHLQNAITVGNALLDRIEVLFGPGSLEYGSDAMGGVIHFRTKEPKLLPLTAPSTEWKANALGRYSSANEEKSFHFDIEGAGKRWGWLTSVSYSDYGDLRVGNRRTDDYPDFGKRTEYVERINGEDVLVPSENVNILNPSGYHQYDFLQKIKFRPNSGLQFVGNFQYSNSGDIPRFDNLSERDEDGNLRFAEWNYGPQARLLGSLKTQIFKSNGFFDFGQVLAAYQFIEEDRITRRVGLVSRETQEEDVSVIGINADFQKYLNNNRRSDISYGIEYNRNDVSSTAFSTNVDTGEKAFDILTRYPDGESEVNNFGIYGKYTLNNRTHTNQLQLGLRYSYNHTLVRYERTDIINWPSNFTDGDENKNSALTWSAGWQGGRSDQLRFRAVVSSAFRVPNVDDLAKIRARVGFVVVPNLDLEPERSVSGEVSLSRAFTNWAGPRSNLSLSITGYYTRLTDAIIRDLSQLPNGDTTLMVSGEPFRIQANVNADKARVYGVSANLEMRILDHWTLKSDYSIQRGRSEDSDEVELPLAHIPPGYGKTSLAYQKDQWLVQLLLRYNAFKPIDQFAPGSSDNEDFATPEGSLGWTTINLYSQFEISEKLSFNLAVENIMDKHYRPFSSGISAPGRNFIIGLNWGF